MRLSRFLSRTISIIILVCLLVMGDTTAWAAPGVSIVQTSGTTVVTEGGATDTYTIVLTEIPSGNVTITLSHGSQISVSPTSLNFTILNWFTPQTVTVTAVDDLVDEANPHSGGNITHSASGGGYGSVIIPNVSVSVNDNDTRGVTRSKTSVAITEGGATDSYTLVLDTQPTADVTITLSHGTQISVSPASLTFTTVNWNAAQTVTVSAVDDFVDEASPHSGGNITHSAAGGDYAGISIGNVSASVTDNDTLGVTITESGGSTDVTEGGATDTYTVVLDTQPTASVTVTLTPDAQVTVSAPTLTFTTVNWNVAQTVTVTAVDDPDDEDSPHTGVITHSATGGGYNSAVIPSVTADITDDDLRGVTIIESGGSTDVTEGGATDTFTVVLDTRPVGGSAVIDLAGTQVSLSPASLTFTNLNWNTPQVVTVTAIDDGLIESSPHAGSITFDVTGGDYDAFAIPPLAVDVTDNDIEGVTIVETDGDTVVTEGGATDTYTVVLDTVPPSDVTITLAHGAQISVSPATLTFTAMNWDTPQIVTVTAVDDFIDEASPHSGGDITHSAAGGGYDSVTIADVSVNVTDNDTAGVTLTPSSVDVTEGGATDTYTVVLDTEPTADVTVTLTPNAQVTVSSPTLTFTAADWDTAQTVTVTAVNDLIDEASPHTGLITHSASGGGYTGVTIADMTANITDNDTAGVTITESGGNTDVTEGGATDTYTVVLDTEPTANVIITLTPDAQVTASAPTLTFTPMNWNIAQTVTVTAVDDPDSEDAHTGVITHSAAGGGYTGVTIASVTANITDNDIKGVTIVESGGSTDVTEGGATDTFTVVLDTRPVGGSTVINLTGTQVTVSPTSLTFTNLNWNTPQVVTVTAIDDAALEASPHAGSISFSATGGGYTALVIPPVAVDITDNDTAGVSVVESSGTTVVTEGGATDSYTVVLTAQPPSNVTISLTHGGQISLSATTLTFTNLNWNTAQTVTVTAVDDFIDESSPHSGGLITHSAAGGGYDSATIADVSVSVNDNDTAGVTLSETSLAVTEGGATDTYTVVLNTEPTANVTITLTPDSQVMVSAPTLTFTPMNWNIAQTVTVTAVNDFIDEASPHASTIAHSAAGGGYTGVSIATLPVNITDNDTAGVTIVQSGGNTTVAEGGATDTYTLVLDTQPTADVTITVTPNTQLSVSPTTLTFTAMNWNIAQTVTVTAVDDLIDETSPHSGLITHSAAGGGYTSVSIASVTADITDNDTAGVTIVQSGGNTVVAEGGATDTYTVVLDTEPTANVTITLTPDAQITTSPTTLTFTTVNWNIAQTVTVTAVDDPDDEGAHTGVIAHNAAGGGYGSVSIASVTANITDNDTRGVTLIESGGSTDVTEGGATDTFTLVFNTRPVGGFATVTLTGVGVTVSPNSLTFNGSNWDTVRTITVTAIDDPLIETSPHAGSVSFSVTSGGDYNGFPIPPVMVNITDNDIAGVTLSKTSASVTEGGAGDTYTVVLNTQPPSDVTITLAHGSEITVTPTTLTFTNANWNVTQTVSIAAVNDFIDETSPHSGGDITHTPSGGGYDSVSIADVAVSITDNDTRGVTRSKTSVTVAEGGAGDSYTLALDSQPTADVTLTLSHGGQINVSPTSLTFTPMNWNVAQTVTVTAVDDLIDEASLHSGGDITHSAAGGDYTGLTIANVSANVNDNDVRGVTRSKTSVDVTEGGATDTYTLVLDTEPTANVTITLSHGGQITVSPATLTFTPSDWMTPQLVTVTAVDDFVDETSPHSGGNITHSAAGGDYTSLSIGTVAASVIDNDTAGVTLVQSGGDTNVTEGGATDTYTVVLDTEPTASVTITITPDIQVTTSPTTLTFTALNWNIAQTVTVTAVDDPDAEDAHTGVITHSAAGGGYSGVTIASVTANITDNDIKGATIVESGGSTNVTEGGATDTFTVVLNTRPTGGSTTMTLTGVGVTVSPSSISFTAGNWDTVRTVTVTAIDDLIDEASPHLGSVSFSTTGGGYNGVVIPSVSVNITDNDTAGVTIVQSGGTTTVTEGGATDTYTVRLDTEPTADVTITLSGSQVTTSPSTLTFTPSNWNTTQTVTVTAIDDAVVESTHAGSVSHSAAGGGYDSVSIASIPVTITDNDTGSLSIAPLTISATEGGATGTYTIMLGAQPAGDVTVTLTPNAQVSVSPPSLTFTNANWDTAQTVTVTAVDDIVVEAAHTGSISHAAAGGGYLSVTGASVTVNITDNDAGGATIVESGGDTEVNEDGLTSDTYTLALSAQPSGTVTVTLTAGVLTTVSPTSLTFTTGNWNTPQTVTVTALNDLIDSGEFFLDTITHSAAGGGYDGAILPDLDVRVLDNDVAGLLVISLLPVGNVVTEGGNTDGFHIRLNSEPTSTVTLGIAPTADYTASPATLTFNASNWQEYQEVIVTAVDDALLEGTEYIPITVPSSGSPGYDGTFTGMMMTVVDNDATVTVDTGGALSLVEGSLASVDYTLTQNDSPVATVTTEVSSTQCVVSTDNSLFSPSVTVTLNGTTPVTVFARAVDDSVAEGVHTCIITHAPTVSPDPSYDGMVISDVSITLIDNDSASILLTQTGGTTAVTEGGAIDSFEVRLSSQPTTNVTVSLTTDGDTGVSPSMLTFTPSTWDDGQTVAVTAVNDRVVEGAHLSVVSFSAASGDSVYNGLTQTLDVGVTDDDFAEILFTDATAENLENAGVIVRTVYISYTTTGAGDFGLAAALTVQLNTTNITASPDDYTLNTSSVTFGVTAANNATRNYSYTLVNDNIAEENETFTITLGSPTSGSAAMMAHITAADSLTATILNDDNAGIVIVESGGSSTVTEGGAGDDYTVALGTEPTGTVTLTLTTSQVTASPTVLTFTIGNWNVAQTVTIDAIDDEVSEGLHNGTVTHTASGGGYSGSTTINIAINDNDAQAVIVEPAVVFIVEGEPTGEFTTFTVQLSSQPTGPVAISMSATQATAEPDSLTFTTDNWMTPQTVTVVAIDDGLIEPSPHTDILTLTATGGGYDDVDIEDVDINIFDNDAEGVLVSETAITALEGGTDGIYTLRLLTQPPNPVTITLTGDPQISLSDDEFTFTDATWNIPQSVTVTALDDQTLETSAQTAVILHTATSADPNYDGIAVPSVTVNIIDGVLTLVQNGGFETAGTTPEKADHWVGKKLVANKDERVCNTVEEPDIAFAGACAFRFNAAAKGATVARKLVQVFNTPAWGAKGDVLTLTAQIRGLKVKSGAKVAIQVVYNNKTKKNVAIAIATGTYDYAFSERTLTLTRRVKKVTVVVNIGKTGGTIWLDDITFTFTPKAFIDAQPRSDGLLPLPPAP